MRKDKWCKGEVVNIFGGRDVWTVCEDNTDDDVILSNKEGVVISCDYARIVSALKYKESEGTHFEVLERELHSAPMTWVPALFAVLIERIRKEPIFKGWVGMQSFISKVYKAAGAN